MDDFLLNQFGLERYTEHERENWSNSNIIIADDIEDIIKFVEKYVKSADSKRLYMGKIDAKLAKRIEQDIGLNLLNYNVAITNSFENSHTNVEKERLRGQIAITSDIVALVPQIVSRYDNIFLVRKTREGKPVIKFVKDINGEKTVIEYISDKKKMLYLQTLYGKTIKKELSPSDKCKSQCHNVQDDLGYESSTNSIPQNQKNAIQN